MRTSESCVVVLLTLLSLFIVVFCCFSCVRCEAKCQWSGRPNNV